MLTFDGKMQPNIGVVYVSRRKTFWTPPSSSPRNTLPEKDSPEPKEPKDPVIDITSMMAKFWDTTNDPNYAEQQQILPSNCEYLRESTHQIAGFGLASASKMKTGWTNDPKYTEQQEMKLQPSASNCKYYRLNTPEQESDTDLNSNYPTSDCEYGQDFFLLMQKHAKLLVMTQNQIQIRTQTIIHMSVILNHH